MRQTRRTAALAALFALAGLASAPARAAESMGIEHEKPVVLAGTVVDLLCALKGSCPPACGAGKRQLGLLTAGGKLHPAAKSGTYFAGATVDLLPYCGKSVEIDGLLIENPAATLLMVQAVRAGPNDAWTPATAFEDAWSAKHGKAEEWFRVDPDIKKAIADNGVLGIKGLEPPK